jgi:recombination protein RecR
MLALPNSLQKLIRDLSRLPSIGEKTATRLAYHLIHAEPSLAKMLSESLSKAVNAAQLCEQCFFVTESTRCPICANPGRDESVVCVVEKPFDLIAIERVGEYRGLYHVLHGVWAPLRGLGPEQMKVAELIERVKAGKVREVILATSSTVEGDATALYVSRLVGELGAKATRLAQGMPKGGELEYADEVTLSRALAGRSTLSG